MIDYNRMLARVKRAHPDADDDELRDICHDWCADAAEEASQRDDTPCIEDGRDNCDDWGTGEGRYHGRI